MPRSHLAWASPIPSPNGKIVVRAGAGLIYGHVPLLAADFAGYQERMITLHPGSPSAQTYTLQNVYQSPGISASSSTMMDPNSSTRTFTWNTEAETPLRQDLTLRVGYYETQTSIFLY